MATSINRPNSQVFMKRLWKGLFHVVAIAVYIVLIFGMFQIGRWLSGILAIGLVLLAQSLRYIASALDRIAHNLNSRSKDHEDGAGTSSAPQTVSAFVTWIFIQGCNGYLVFETFRWSTLSMGYRVLCALVVVEMLYLAIRFINRSISYEPASFGIGDGHVLRDRPSAPVAAQERERKRVESRLGVLKTMYENGEISREAYLKAKDKYLVHLVMDSPDDEFAD